MAIQMLLVEDVENLGRSGDIVKVRPGYARNFLLPQGFAMVADKQALRQQARLQDERSKLAVVEKQESENIAEQITGVIISVIVKVDRDGHMYGSVSAGEIVDLIKKEKGVEIEKRSIQLKHPIKETGVHNIIIKLKEGITSSVTLKVLSEHAAAEAAAEEAKAPKEKQQ